MRVGLVAMSGTRIYDPQLLSELPGCAGALSRLGAVASLPSLALLTVAALIRDKVEVEYLQCPNVNDWKELPSGFDLVAISSYTCQMGEAYELADRFKAAGTPCVLGGTHVTMLPGETTSRGHTAAIGEAELIWPEIIADALAGKLKPSYGTLGVVCDITKSPLPAFDLLDPEKFKRIPIQASRGCPHRCEFCATSVLWSPRHRQKTIKQVLAEIDRVLEIWKRPFIEFVDDNALVDHQYWKELLSELKKRKIRWFAECDISIGEDDDLVTLMAESGCREVLIGLESPQQSDLCGLELNNDWKAGQQAKYRDHLNNIQNHGVRVIGCFMMALDQQSPDSADLIYDFIREMELFDIQITLQTVFPGTPLYARLEKEKRLKAPTNWSRCTLFDLNIIPATGSEEAVVNSFRTLLKRVHSNAETAWRWQQFRERLKSRNRQPSLSRTSSHG
jgi:radical SAM superfamily enzyme YgiQ (UPF0313 family)